jgi:hypothetical protein
VYSKDGIAVSAMFVGPTGNTCRAGLVIYSRMAPDARSFLTPPPEITDDEQETLLGTVAGRWEGYEPPAPLGGKPEKLISVSSRPAQILKRRDAARDAVQKAVVSLYPARAGYLCLRMPPKDVGRITGKVFAFRVARGLAICSYDDVPAIMAWADRVAADREAASRAPKSPLSGF